MQQMMQKQAQEESERRSLEIQREMMAKNQAFSREQSAQDRVNQAQDGQMAAAQRMGANEGNAIDRLLGVFQRSVR